MAVDVFYGMNDRQREAIAHGDGPLLVVAGAGSGKTRVITHRIAHLIQGGVRPDHILAITFTNKAAGEMQERVEDLLGLRTPWITTFHSAGLRILKLEQARLGLAHPFTIIDADDQKKMWKRVLAELELDPKQFDPRAVAATVGRWKNELITVEKAAEQVDDARGDELLACYRTYVRLCREECVYDFDDLLLEPVRLFEQDGELLARYRERFPHILIDEYQDTNHAQYRFFRLLAAHGNICATGDPDQAIYGWRGADINNILDFETDFPNCRVVLLEQNYRSTKCILAAAQAVVEHNVQRKDKTIFTDNAAGEPIRLITVDDQDDEAMAIAAAIDRLGSEGRRLSDIAVFYRMNAQSRTLEEWLIRRGVPYRIFGGTRFYDRGEVKDLLAYCKLLVNPRDLLCLQRIINVPRRGIGAKTFGLLRRLAGEQGVALFEVLMTESLLERVAVGRAERPLRAFVALLRRLQDLDLRDTADCIEQVLQLTGLEEFHLENDPERGQERAANLREALTAAQQFALAHPDAGLEGFLDHVSLLTSQDNRHGGEDQVALMTLHASKGLEFPVVFIAGCEQGVLPLVREGHSADYEEERRLMYVGITRAQERLFLSRAVSRQHQGRWTRNPPSMFLAEIPDGCIEHRDRVCRPEQAARRGVKDGPGYPEASLADYLTGDGGAAAAQELLSQMRGRLLTTGSALKASLGADPGSAGAAQRRRAAAGAAAIAAAGGLCVEDLQPGLRIRHRSIGVGTVLRLAGPEDDPTIHIDFDDLGEKELLLAYAAAQLVREQEA
ncbi:MAG: ATP-dependent helicase [Planctomycetota bacterium]